MHKLAVLFGVALLTTPAAADTSFGAGSIIIPASAPYQTDCGAVSLYGFVYNILRANAWLNTNGHGKIEVYYGYDETKASPNRCTPTNLHKGPAYPGKSSPTHDDLKWNDGCDFEVYSASVVPVMKMTNTSATNVATDAASFATINTSDTTHTGTGGRATFPNWPSKTIQRTLVASTNVTTVRYWGGSFIINDQDAVVLRKLVQGTLVAKDSANNNIDLSGFRTSSCTYGTTVGGQVNFHVAQVAFTAPTPKQFTSPPPRLALLARNGNQSPADGSFSPTTPGTTSKTGRIADAILQEYLERAGLTFAGSQGCPIGGYLAGTSLCPSPNAQGQIYDVLDFRDLVDGKLTFPTYKMLWMPHWEMKATNPNADEITAINNIAAFANNQAGVMAECASIESLEGALTTAHTHGQFQTCSSSTCGATSAGLTKNSGGAFASDPATSLKNCTDPTLSAGSDCAFFSVPGDPYAQTAEYRWHGGAVTASRVADFKPAASSTYRTGVLPLISGVSSLDPTKVGSAAAARSMIKGDYVTRGNKDGAATKSNILYLGNHNQSVAVAGTKVVLQTLLQLGDPPPVVTNREVSRATPIVTTIGTQTLLVQGTFEQITPPPTTRTATTNTEVATFEFPYLLGHLRGIKTNAVSTTAVDFNALGSSSVAFDGGANIPPVTATGCGTNFSGSCRTVFTHTTTGQRPAMRFVKTAGSDFTAIKDLIAPGLTDQTTVVSRILAGIPDGTGGYVPKLGGIDHSTAAIIGPSAVAGLPTRPQMIYVGATDGMLHAFCAKAVAGTPCTVDGRELWAFIPRTLLPRLRKNTQRIDGSPRVVDLFGDFDPTDGQTLRSFRTILMFQTGSGDPATSGETPSAYALDVTDPANPTILWEYTTPSTRGVTDFGQGITISAGRTTISGKTRNVAYAQTNNGGTGTAGSVVTALDVETGLKLWQTGYVYPAPRVAASGLVPAAGIPGGAIGVDRNGNGSLTDVLFGTLYGDLWRLDAATGANQYGSNALFRFSDDKKPFGSPLSIYSNDGKTLFTVGASGGYFDPFALSQWAGDSQQVVAMQVGTAQADTPLTQSSTVPTKLAWKIDLAAGDKAFAQAVIVGDQLFVTTDSTDVNSTTFGGTASGKLYRMDLANGGTSSSVVISGGAGSIASNGTTLYASSGKSVAQISTAARTAVSAATNVNPLQSLARVIWLSTR
jgi:hypothetical protein